MDTGLAGVIAAGLAAIASIITALIAKRAVNNTKPISNGFAKDTIRRLDRIETLITHHIEEHADSDVRRRTR